MKITLDRVRTLLTRNLVADPLWKRKPPVSYLPITAGTIEAWLVSDDATDRQFAKVTLEQMGAEAAISYLARLLELESQRLKERRRLAVWIGMMVIVAAYLVEMVLLKDHPYFALLLPLIGIHLVFLMFRTDHTTLLRRILLCAAESQDIRNIGILIDSWAFRDGETSKAVATALTGLLPSLSFENRSFVEERHWKALLEWLKPMAHQSAVASDLLEPDAAFLKAVIQALGNVRHPAALPILQKIARQESLWHRWTELRKVAAHYVTIWETEPAVVEARAAVSVPAIQMIGR